MTVFSNDSMVQTLCVLPAHTETLRDESFPCFVGNPEKMPAGTKAWIQAIVHCDDGTFPAKYLIRFSNGGRCYAQHNQLTQDPRVCFDAKHGIRTDGQIHLGSLNVHALSDADLVVAMAHPALHHDVRECATLIHLSRVARAAGELTMARRLTLRAGIRVAYDMPTSCRYEF